VPQDGGEVLGPLNKLCAKHVKLLPSRDVRGKTGEMLLSDESAWREDERDIESDGLSVEMVL